MHVRRLVPPLVITASVAALALAGAVPASAGARSSSSPTVEVVNDTVLAPYHLSTSDNRLLVADGGTSLVSRVASNGKLTTVATGPQPGEVAGVAAGDGGFAYTWTDYSTGAAGLTIRTPGKADVTADLSGFESTQNPNGKVTYGILHKVTKCQQKALDDAQIPVQYQGDVNSHPYAVTYGGSGVWYVADAGGNDVIRVSPSGTPTLVKVLPRQPLHITKAFAQANNLASCTVGLTYYTDPVSTGIDRHDGKLYVSTLPGGPEDPSAGPRGSVYRMSEDGSGLTRLATGFAGATDVTVAPNGKVYVAELFGGEISTIKNGHAEPVVALPNVVSVSYGLGALYAGVAGPTDDQGNPTGQPGSIVRVDLH
jgi:hypothetical protein